MSEDNKENELKPEGAAPSEAEASPSDAKADEVKADAANAASAETSQAAEQPKESAPEAPAAAESTPPEPAGGDAPVDPEREAKLKAAAEARAARAAAKAAQAGEGEAPVDPEREAKLKAAAEARAARAAAKAAAEGGGEAPAAAGGEASGDDDKEAKAKAAAEARAARAAARAKATEGEADKPKEPSPNQPKLDEAVKIIQAKVAADALEQAFINEMDRHLPTLVVKNDHWLSLAELLKSDEYFGMDYLRNVAGVDHETHMEVVYHFVSTSTKEDYCVKVKADRDNPSVHSVTPIWHTANWNEREIYDLLGIDFPGHPNLRRIMMPDDWVGHPLRKDYIPLDPEV